jgi:hypothetical protein
MSAVLPSSEPPRWEFQYRNSAAFRFLSSVCSGIFTLAVYALPFFVAINAAIWALQAALACSARR